MMVRLHSGFYLCTVCQNTRDFQRYAKISGSDHHVDIKSSFAGIFSRVFCRPCHGRYKQRKFCRWAKSSKRAHILKQARLLTVAYKRKQVMLAHWLQIDVRRNRFLRRNAARRHGNRSPDVSDATLSSSRYDTAGSRQYAIFPNTSGPRSRLARRLNGR